MPKVLDIYGKNYSGVTNQQREASRAIILQDGKLLLSHEVNISQWMLPGGGLEAGETPEECCIREVGEETGCLVIPGNCFLVLNEYYEDWKFVSYFFLCEVVGNTQRHPTKRELRVGAAPEWLPVEDALDIFSHHADYEETDEERRGIYLREYTALTEYFA